eukprot:TRINITY_DN44653_c0_g1_i1.p2 TRINITY_DN44653_c0_g1~~TRINITY_DN44653_c0_g1_i1.p2  ORF type:complete len:218 (+),score=85.82 TRINITY_DN44653_c0_g1_i1:42-656(+)
MRDAETVRNYAGRAASFARWAERTDSAAAVAEVRDAFVSALGSGRGAVVDVGCGSGRDLAAFAAAGFDPVGVDPCAELCDIAKRLCPQAEVQCADVRDAVLPRGAAGVWCMASLFHVPRQDLPALLARLAGCVRAGGLVLTTFPDKPPRNSRGSDGRWKTYLPLVEHTALVRRAGLDVLSAGSSLRLYNGTWGVVLSRRLPAML